MNQTDALLSLISVTLSGLFMFYIVAFLFPPSNLFIKSIKNEFLTCLHQQVDFSRSSLFCVFPFTY